MRLSAGAVLLVVGDESPSEMSPRKGGTFSLFPSPPRPVRDTRTRLGFGVWSGVGGSQTECDVDDDASD